MTLLFPAIIFVNNDLSPAVQATLSTQLMLTEVIDGYEFDQRIATNPNYPTEVHLNNLRVLVVRSFYETTNRSLADVVIFIKDGLAYVESSKFGPPGQCFPVARLQLEQLLTAQAQQEVFIAGDNIQSNILYPLFPHNKTYKYPFGTDCITEAEDDIDDDDDGVIEQDS